MSAPARRDHDNGTCLIPREGAQSRVEVREGRLSGDHVISVLPVEGGWSLECATGLRPLHFLSGGRAEESAHALARTLAELGRDVRILVHDRQRTLIGTARYFGGEDATTLPPTP